MSQAWVPGRLWLSARPAISATAKASACSPGSLQIRRAHDRRVPVRAGEVEENRLPRVFGGGPLAPRTNYLLPKMATEMDIELPERLERVRGDAQLLSKFGIHIYYGRRHVFSEFDLKVLTVVQPLTYKVLSLYRDKKRPLWCYFVDKCGPETKAVVRKTGTLVCRRALFAALERNQYGPDGRSLKVDGERLYGTIKMVSAQPKLTTNVKHSDLVDRLSRALRERIIPALRRSAGE